MAARSTVAVAIALIISGCFPPPTNVVGAWQGRHPLPAESNASEPVRNTLERVNVTFDDEGHYMMTWRGLPISGDYSVAGSAISMTPKLVLRRPISSLGEGMRSFGAALSFDLRDGRLVGQMEGVKVVLNKISK